MKTNREIIEEILSGDKKFLYPESVNINGVIIVFTETHLIGETGYYNFYNKKRLSATIHLDTIIKCYKG